MLMNVKMPTIIDILIFISRMITVLEIIFFFMLMNVKLPTIVDIYLLIFIRRIITTSMRIKAGKEALFFSIVFFGALERS